MTKIYKIEIAVAGRLSTIRVQASRYRHEGETLVLYDRLASVDTWVAMIPRGIVVAIDEIDPGA